MSKEDNSENSVVPKTEGSDMNRLRDLLFGEQALQTDDRFAALEMAVNSLRRENRSLRQALEIEAMSRLEASREESAAAANNLDQSVIDMAQVLLSHLANEKTARTNQASKLADSLAAMQKSQDETTAQLISHLQQEQKTRAAQFTALRDSLAADAESHNELTDSVANMLKSMAEARESSKNERVSA